MNRRSLQLSVLIALTIFIFAPAAASGHIATKGTAIDSGEKVQAASSMEYEFPPAPQERTRDACERISRFCDWLTTRGALVEKDSEEESDTATTTSTTDSNELEIAHVEAIRADEDEDEDEGSDDAESSNEESNASSSNGTQNRSVVGWQSATIGSFQQQTSPDPVKLEVPSLSISADVTGVGIGANREMVVPDDYNTVGWYRYGPRPGDEGSSVIAGHLDDAFGRSVFFDLQYIDIGEYVHITMDDGEVRSFQVTATVSYDSQNLPREIFTREGRPQLALLTCGGKWDSSAGRYTETVVVFGMPVD
jgi:sortase (surface protein transpeptidase)